MGYWQKNSMNVWSCSHLQLCVTPWTVAWQAPLSVKVPRQGYWSGLPYPPPGDLPNPGIEPGSLTSPAQAAVFFTSHLGCLVRWQFVKTLHLKFSPPFVRKRIILVVSFPPFFPPYSLKNATSLAHMRPVLWSRACYNNRTLRSTSCVRNSSLTSCLPIFKVD